MKNRVKVASLCAFCLMMEGVGVMNMVTLTEDQTKETKMGIRYAVSCLDDEGNRVRTTRKDFDTKDLAIKYADGCAQSRWAKVHMLCIWCGKGWNMDKDNWHCSKCGAS